MEKEKKIEYNNRKVFTLSILIAALYAVITIIFGSISFSAIIQVRISDSLIPLSYNKRIGKAAIYGTTLGTIVSNIISVYGLYDIMLGALANFFASYVAYLFSRHKSNLTKILATISSTIVVVFFIGIMLFHLVLQMPLETSLIGVSIGSFISIILLGTILLIALEKVYQ